MVTTGASSGIGGMTVRAAAERGTRRVLASHSQAELQQLKAEITGNGGQAIAVAAADVGKEEDLRGIAQRLTNSLEKLSSQRIQSCRETGIDPNNFSLIAERKGVDLGLR